MVMDKARAIAQPTKLCPRVSVWDSNVIDTLIKQWVQMQWKGMTLAKDSWQTVLERAGKAG